MWDCNIFQSTNNPFLGTACKQQRHHKFMKFAYNNNKKKQLLKSGDSNAPLLQREQTVISVT